MSKGVKYAVDLVMCIDGTGSMGHLVDEVKSSALKFYESLESVMAKKEKTIDQLRAKVIVFRDYWADSPTLAMQSSDFFDLRTQSSEFESFVSGIKATGGGDEPENGLEGLALALNSDWEQSQDFSKQRYVVIVYTDASAHDLEKAGKPSHYPKDIPGSFDDLTDFWSDIPAPAKRLLLFAPDASPWTVMASSWENTIHFASQAGNGLEEIEMDEILNAIAGSI
ncbi:MAG: VWA domain-containing protein [Cyanobacteria bacterium J06650_10]